MRPHLKVLSPGSHTTVQDQGRFGFQDIGVPVSGGLDSTSLRIANALVGNPAEVGCLEVLYQGPTLEVCADSVRIAIAGSDASLECLGDYPKSVSAWRSVTLHRGQVFRINPARGSSCCYLGLEAGFELEACLGSLSTYVRGGFGGHEGRELRTGDEIPLVSASAPERPESELPTPPIWDPRAKIRFIWGPQKDFFTDESVATFASARYTVSDSTDRMGMRLLGPELCHLESFNIVSDGVATGAIQVPGNGQPIILLPDRQTTGGYPKIASIISADLPAIGRRRPGHSVEFTAVDVETAQEIRHLEETKLQALLASIQPVSTARSIDSGYLYGNNLISGVVSARKSRDV